MSDCMDPFSDDSMIDSPKSNGQIQKYNPIYHLIPLRKLVNRMKSKSLVLYMHVKLQR